MIRSAFIRPVVFATKGQSDALPKRVSFMVYRSATSTKQTLKASPTSSSTPLAILPFYRSLHHGLMSTRPFSRSLAIRASSSSAGEKKSTAENQSTGEVGADSEPTSQEIVLTPGEKVVVGTRLFFWAGALAFASVCAYYIGKELLPTKMSPNTVFDKATNVIRENEEVKRRFGEGFKTYGRDHGGHREGRRNFIEHTEYTSEVDGSKRTRVRFNLEGPYGHAFVFAEVSKDMPSGEFVYILVQDKRNGAVITVQDNRAALLAKKLAGGSQEGLDVFTNLLGGGKK